MPRNPESARAASRTSSRPIVPGRRAAEPAPADPLRPVRTSDPAQITGFARETARRQPAALECEGLIRRDDAAWLQDVTRTETDLRTFTIESLRRFVQTAEAMQTAIADASTALSGSRTARSTEVPTTARTTGARRSRRPPRRG